jgi:hypothetical protein
MEGGLESTQRLSAAKLFAGLKTRTGLKPTLLSESCEILANKTKRLQALSRSNIQN